MWCVCTCGVVCCVYMCGVGGACGGACGVVWCVGCVVLVVRGGACGVVCGETWHAENPRVYVQNASVCTVRTSPCVPATGPHVLDIRACCRYTRRRPDRTHGGVLDVHTGGFSSPLLFSCLVSLLTCFFLFFFFSFSSSFLLHLLFHLLFLHTQGRDQTDK